MLLQNGKPLVEDLFRDLRDGEVLLSLLEILTAQQYVIYSPHYIIFIYLLAPYVGYSMAEQKMNESRINAFETRFL